MANWRYALTGLLLPLIACTGMWPDTAVLYGPAPGLFDQDAPDLGLEPATGTETFTVFHPTDNTDRFSNGAVPIVFRGQLFVQWQSSRTDEDAPDTWVAYSTSKDGAQSWSAPQALASASAGEEMRSSGGWWTDGETLVAYINVWPEGFHKRTGGYTEYRLSKDGETWTEPKQVTDADGVPVNGVIEQDPHLYGERLYTAFHVRPGIVARPFFSDDPTGVSGWTMGEFENLPSDPPMSRELEPSLFQRGACLVMVFRDQASSFRQLASESCDRGASWTRPAITPMPDARTKQSAGNLPGGSVFLVHTPHAGKERIPLALSLSPDGRVFDRSYLLRGPDDLQDLRDDGLYKRPGYHYPKSVVSGDYLYVAYTANKEDVQVTRVPLAGLGHR